MDDLMVRMAAALRLLDEAYCDVGPRMDRHKGRQALMRSREALAEYDALKAQPSLGKSGDGVEQPTQPDVVAAAALPEWMHDPGKVAELLTHLEEAGWRPDSNGDPECVNQACAMAADVVRLVLMPMLIPTSCTASPSTADVAGWKLVPIEPTEEMIHDMCENHYEEACKHCPRSRIDEKYGTVFPMCYGIVEERYKAMLSAAPDPVSHATGQEKG